MACMGEALVLTLGWGEGAFILGGTSHFQNYWGGGLATAAPPPLAPTQAHSELLGQFRESDFNWPRQFRLTQAMCNGDVPQAICNGDVPQVWVIFSHLPVFIRVINSRF